MVQSGGANVVGATRFQIACGKRPGMVGVAHCRDCVATRYQNTGTQECTHTSRCGVCAPNTRMACWMYSLLNSGIDIYTYMVRMYICICICINMCESQNMSGYYKYDVDLFGFHAFEVEETHMYTDIDVFANVFSRVIQWPLLAQMRTDAHLHTRT